MVSPETAEKRQLFIEWENTKMFLKKIVNGSFTKIL